MKNQKLRKYNIGNILLIGILTLIFSMSAVMVYADPNINETYTNSTKINVTRVCLESTTSICVFQQNRSAVSTTRILHNCDKVTSGSWCDYGCEDGKCMPASTCTETDSGLDYTNKGTTCNNDVCKSDTCVTDSVLAEYHCISSTQYGGDKSYTCPNGCQDGKCLIKQVCAKPLCEGVYDTDEYDESGCPIYKCPTTTCTDSDKGKNYYVKGRTTYTAPGILDDDDDTCVNNKTLAEQYCDGNSENKQSYYDCPNGCQDGRCLLGSISCTMPKCKDAYKTGEYEDNGCPIYQCPPIACTKPKCEGVYDTDEYDKNGCHIYKCPIITCEVFATCEEGYSAYKTGEYTNDGCPIYKCIANTCKKPVCDNPIYTDKYDEIGCQIFICPVISCEIPVCENAIKTEKYTSDGCPIYVCQTTVCAKPKCQGVYDTDSYDENGCHIYKCPPIEYGITYFVLEKGDTEKISGKDLYFTIKDIGTINCYERSNCDTKQVLLSIVDGEKSQTVTLAMYETVELESCFVSYIDINDQGQAKFKLSEKITSGTTSAVTAVGYVLNSTNEKTEITKTQSVKSNVSIEQVSSDTGTINKINPTKECDGCIIGDRCVSYGIRTKNGESAYCDIDGMFKQQKNEDNACENNYECVSNTCSSKICVDMVKKIDQQTSMMDSILSWLKKIFG